MLHQLYTRRYETCNVKVSYKPAYLSRQMVCLIALLFILTLLTIGGHEIETQTG